MQKIYPEPEKKGKYIDIAGRFIDEHLLNWAPVFTRDMEEASEQRFYKALARATRNVIDFMRKTDYAYGRPGEDR